MHDPYIAINIRSYLDKEQPTLKPISIYTTAISKTMSRKLACVSIFDKDENSYTTSAYLIAQLGKNYSLPCEDQISGSTLLEIALNTISKLKYSIGGKIEFLNSNTNTPHFLHQLLKFI